MVTIPDESDPYDTYSIDMTDMVNGWLTSSFPNFGVAIKHFDEANY